VLVYFDKLAKINFFSGSEEVGGAKWGGLDIDWF